MVNNEKFKMVSLEIKTQETLRRLCLSEGRTYSKMINLLIDYWNEVKE
jgi:hypothetical protein